MFLGNKALILDQPARLVGMFPVRHIVEQERKPCVRLRVLLPISKFRGA